MPSDDLPRLPAADARRLNVLLLEAPRLQLPHAAKGLERKTAALLARLALEGPAPRAALAQLLWPETAETAARANLRQLLRRLRLAAGAADLVADAGDTLALGADARLDVLLLREAARAGRHAEVLAAPGELLGSETFDDVGELAAWVDEAREQVRAWRRTAREAEVARLEAAGELGAALALAEEWAQAEPASEEAGRAQMRLHYQLGGRTAALLAWERLRRALSQALDVEPMEETRALARTIERGARLLGVAAPPSPARRALPPSVLRPPVLAGREEAWRALSEGWDRGQVLYISGAPGAGKSRLAQDFAESKGRWMSFDGRVDDREVPYASQTRNFRLLLAARPDVQLEPWARRELGRVVPELLAPDEPVPGPLRSEAEQVRFFRAARDLYVAGCDHLRACIVDDMQYYDPGSVTMARFCLGELFPLGRPGSMPPILIAYRAGELRPAHQQQLVNMELAGLSRNVHVEPLDARGVARLLEGLGVPALVPHAERLARYTGGNPLFVVETVKHLLETGAHETGWPERLPPPGKVAPLIQQRLQRVSPAALRLARVAALAGTQFTLTLASAVLEASLVDVGEAAAELEEAQVLRSERFTHDLVHEAVEAGTPPALARALHARLAEVLVTRAAPPVRVAHHWFAAGESQRAVPFLMQAAGVDEDVMLPTEAADLYARAAGLLEGAGQLEQAAAARRREAECRRAAGSRLAAAH
ncbi:AAA family ATPase [Aggregicoccus sp. 17bor-14]|uniref:AAA family ATPase n=1 Tax=Myxococcaceae TaxID=31 RepID=UPI00129C8BBD|nr:MULTISPECIES: AAA family ATPase [Myxococcaceae]MBF5043394.1 AAA family ATPase [Simulacricoccus sp. 17bor-14]MRI89152.1 AAA family ATPase [Aggregicoccus sp. 17bor-14]